MSHTLDEMKNAYEKYKEEAAVYGGPAVIDVFGEEPFSPVMKPEAVRLDAAGQKLQAEYSIAA